MDASTKREVLQIKKYPNRRYYDATRSCHVTLHEVYDLILNGFDVVISDSRTGEDITNLVLLQVLLEKDQPKLDLFPAGILHLMIRSNRQMVRMFADRAFGPLMNVLASSQKQWDNYWRQAMSGKLMTPFDWAQSMMHTFSGKNSSQEASVPPGEGIPEWGPEEPPVDGTPVGSQAMGDLREQVAHLTKQIEFLTSKLAEQGRNNRSNKKEE